MNLVASASWINSSPPRQNGRHFADDIFRCIFQSCSLIKISLKFVPMGLIDNNPALVKIIAWSQVIIWTNAYPIHWHIYAALGGDELMLSMPNSLEYIVCVYVHVYNIYRDTLPMHSRNKVSAVVADGSALIWHLDISTHDDDESRRANFNSALLKHGILKQFSHRHLLSK